MLEFLTSATYESSHSSLKLHKYSASILWSSSPPVPAKFFCTRAPEVVVAFLVMVWRDTGICLLITVEITLTALEEGV